MKAKENEQRKITKRKETIKTKEQQGITLIALIITIIIMLILAGVTINVAIGDNGLFSKSKEAVEMHKEASALEKINMAIGEYMLDINALDIREEEKEGRLAETLSKLGEVEEGGTYIRVIVDDYVFDVDKDSLEITKQGKDNAEDAKTVTISETSKNIELNVGETGVKINYSIEPKGASLRNATWKSSDTDVVGVRNGIMTAKKAGTATITVRTKEGKEDTCTVTVTGSGITSISVSPSTLRLTTVDATSQKLTVTIEPENVTNKTIRWISDNENVAKVNNQGEVTAVGAGNCTIKAISEQDESIYGSCEVTVEALEVSSISLNPTTLKLEVGGKSSAIGVTYNPSNATDKTITWSSDTPAVATVDSNGIVTGVSEGKATITGRTANGKTATCVVAVGNVTVKRIGDTIILPKTDYGKVVTGYNSKTSGITWRLFYVDDTANNVYLIGDFITTAQAPTKIVNGTTYTVNGGQNEYCSYFTNMLPAYTHNASTNNIGNASKWIWDNQQSIATKWLSQWYNYGSHKTTGDNNNMKAVAYMMDTTIWTHAFEDTTNKASYVLGGPTTEMYCASYKDSHPSKYLESRVNGDVGYEVAWNDNGTIGSYSYYQNGVDTTGNNKIYAPGSSSYPVAMWLASPSSSSTGNVMCAGYNGDVGNHRYDNTYIGFCPIVSLKSGVQIVPDGNGYRIQ